MAKVEKIQFSGSLYRTKFTRTPSFNSFSLIAFKSGYPRGLLVFYSFAQNFVKRSYIFKHVLTQNTAKVFKKVALV